MKVGWFSAHPGQSCKHILTSGDSKGDGPYWLDPGNNGNPFKAYCDMSAEGGERGGGGERELKYGAIRLCFGFKIPTDARQ